jgi:hypothetical protein
MVNIRQLVKRITLIINKQDIALYKPQTLSDAKYNFFCNALSFVHFTIYCYKNSRILIHIHRF